MINKNKKPNRKECIKQGLFGTFSIAVAQ